MKIDCFSKKNYILKKNHSWFYVCNKTSFSESLKKVLENPNAFCQKDVLKEDESFTTTVAKICIDNKVLVIKRYNIKSFTHAWKRAIQPSRAARCWYYSHLLQEYGINTPAPIAMIEKRFGPLRRQAYFITEFIEGPDAFTAFKTQPDSESITAERASNMMLLLNDLRKKNLYHGDLKSTNFIFKDVTPYLIDLDAMHLYRSKTKIQKKLAKDKQRFLLNWQDLDVMKYFSDWSKQP